MKTKRIWLVLAAIIVMCLIVTTVAYAYTSLWSASTNISIVAVDSPPTDGGGGGGGGGGGDSDSSPPQPLQAANTTLTDGSGTLVDGIWSANFTQGIGGTCTVTIYNPRSTAAQIEMLVDGVVVVEVDGQGVEAANPVPGVSLYMFTDTNATGTITAGSTATVMWSFHVSDDAQLGALPNISLEIREK